jgi:hypothetical protein
MDPRQWVDLWIHAGLGRRLPFQSVCWKKIYFNNKTNGLTTRGGSMDPRGLGTGVSKGDELLGWRFRSNGLNCAYGDGPGEFFSKMEN